MPVPTEDAASTAMRRERDIAEGNSSMLRQRMVAAFQHFADRERITRHQAQVLLMDRRMPV